MNFHDTTILQGKAAAEAADLLLESMLQDSAVGTVIRFTRVGVNLCSEEVDLDELEAAGSATDLAPEGTEMIVFDGGDKFGGPGWKGVFYPVQEVCTFVSEKKKRKEEAPLDGTIKTWIVPVTRTATGTKRFKVQAGEAWNAEEIALEKARKARFTMYVDHELAGPAVPDGTKVG